MLKYNKSMKIGFNSLKNKLIGIKVDLNQKYMELKEFYKGKIDWTENHSKELLNLIGRKQFLFIYRYSRIIIPKTIKLTGLILLSGGAVFITTTSIFSPINFLHQIFGYGLGIYIGSKYTMKIWNYYVYGKIQINQGIQEVKEVKNDMG